MAKIKISAESTIDLTKELLTKYDINTVPFTLQLGDKTALDGEITADEIIDYVSKTKILPKTSAVNEYQYTEHFTNLLKDADAVIHFTLSAEMSLANSNARRAADAINAQKEGSVYVIDTRSLSTGIALLAIYAKELVDKGFSAAEVYQKCLERVPYVQASFELNRVDYLYKGGRCSALVYLGANLLKIRPQILVKDGKMVSGKKYRGKYSQVVEKYCQDVLQEFDNPDLTRAFLTYTTADEKVLEIAKNSLIEAGFKEILVTRAGGTITSHCGEDCLGILYINDGGKNA